MFFVLWFFALIQSASAYTRPPKPLFEGGLFAAAGSTADYPASDQIRARFLPLPYFVYRGQILKSDDKEGTRLEMLKAERLQLDMSFGGSFPAEGSIARAGMPDLDWTIELGPRLLYYLAKDEIKTVRLGLPLRAAFATDFRTTRHIGYTLAPTFQIDWYNLPLQNLSLYFIANANFLNRSQAGYFYDVDSIYATPDRPAYNARPGYLGYDLSLAFKYANDKTIFIAGARFADHGASVNAGSPLHRKSTEWIYFAGAGVVLFASDESEVIY